MSREQAKVPLTRRAGDKASGFITSADIAEAIDTVYDDLEEPISAGTVTGEMLANSAVTGSKIQDGTITSAKIADGTIVDADINASAAIARSKISGTALTADSMGVFSVLDFGAKGDGVTDDLDAFLAAVATGKSLLLTSGATYLVSGRITLGAGQNLYGNGATIKRADQVSTTTTTTITSGATSAITVASVAGLKVGQYINVEQGGQAATTEANSGVTFDQTPRRITDITGNVVTISGTFAVSLSGTTNVHTSGILLSAASGHSTVRDLTVDGNRDNHTWAYWSAVIDVYVGSYAHVDHVHVVDSAAEAFIIGGTYPRVTNCSVVDCDGNAYHLSGATHPVIDKCSAVGSNLAGSPGTGHADGCITWSDAIVDGTISDCYLSGGLLAGISGIGVGNSDITITGCTIRDMTERALFISGSAADTTNPARIVFTDNRIYDSVKVELSTSASPLSYVRDFIIADNYLENTQLRFSNTQDGIVNGNTVRVTDDAFTAAPIWAHNNLNLHIKNNQVIGTRGTNAIDCWDDSSPIKSSGVVIEGNTISESRMVSGSYGVYISRDGTNEWVVRNNTFDVPIGFVTNSKAIYVNYAKHVLIEGNTIYGGNNVNGWAAGIEVVCPATILGNTVLGAGYGGINLMAGSTGVVANNTVKNCGQNQVTNPGIQVQGSNFVISGNRCYDDQGTKTQEYGIRLYAGDNHQLCGNMVVGNKDVGILVRTTSPPTNVNSVPVRKVAATVGSSQTAVAHGLGYIPIAVQVSMTSAGTVWQSAAADATNVYLTADDAARTCDVMVG